MERLFHLFSNGSGSPDLFVSEKDLDQAMNLIAVVAAITGCAVLAFDVEDTHLHILMKAEHSRAIAFKIQYQKRIRDHLTRLRNDSRHIDFSIELIEVTDPTYAKRVGAYVICQATKDGKKILPYDYRWSSASLYFRTQKNDLLWRTDAEGRLKRTARISELPLRYKNRIFHIGFDLPDDWEVCEDLILPSSYVDVKGFEEIYRTPNTFRVFLGGSGMKDNEILECMSSVGGAEYEESEARIITSDLSAVLYGKRTVRELDIEKRFRLGRELRQRYRMGLAQIARRIYLPEDEVRKYIK